jgi:hypothetical protein
MAVRWPDLQATGWGKNCQWRGRLQPTQLSLEYAVRIEYEPPLYPRAFVDDPPLQRRPQEPDRPIPHVWSKPVIRPCLFKFHQWRPDLSIVRIADWLVEWLFFYEIWQAVGEWKGGGEPVAGKVQESVPHS